MGVHWQSARSYWSRLGIGLGHLGFTSASLRTRAPNYGVLTPLPTDSFLVSGKANATEVRMKKWPAVFLASHHVSRNRRHSERRRRFDQPSSRHDRTGTSRRLHECVGVSGDEGWGAFPLMAAMLFPFTHIEEKDAWTRQMRCLEYKKKTLKMG